MRKYSIPDAENLIGGDVQGLYPNYPYNDLRPDVYFHDGINSGAINRTSGCNTFSNSLTTYRALGDRADVNGEPSGYSRKAFTFSSPELMFTKPYLNAYETRIYGQLTGNSSGYFKPSEDHPQFKLLRNGGAVISAIIGLGYAFHQIAGTETDSFEGAKANSSSVTGIFAGLAGLGSIPNPVLVIPQVAGAIAAAETSLALELVQQFLVDDLLAVGDFYSGGVATDVVTAISEATQVALGAVPGVIGASKQRSRAKFFVEIQFSRIF
jgi:hypothetical protein